MKSSSKYQGKYRRLVQASLICSSVSGLMGCEPAEAPIQVQRAVYKSVQECEEDWGPSLCEEKVDPASSSSLSPDLTSSPPAASSPLSRGTSSVFVPHFWGPYYSVNPGGGVSAYHYNGVVQPASPPSRNIGAVSFHPTAPSSLFSTPGKYSSTPAHPLASPGKASAVSRSVAARGGVGGRGAAGG